MLLQIQALEVQYGKSRILHGVSLDLGQRPLAVVGRNGMGKTTLCHAIMGMAPVTGGSMRLDGIELVGLKPHRIARLGLALVPQGRRVFPSLTVEEHLRLVERPGVAKWTRERIYSLFPRLHLRRRNTGAQLSGGGTADARDCACAALQSPADDHGRTDRGSSADDDRASCADDEDDC